jgi:hypothetical protein
VSQDSVAPRPHETGTMFPHIQEGIYKLVRASAQNNLWLGQGANETAERCPNTSSPIRGISDGAEETLWGSPAEMLIHLFIWFSADTLKQTIPGWRRNG